ncbi:hypothetical protein LWI29_009909 [Acer saccharum]|uniref:NB-ARC domain-containing protein n=1 Tax=Acer saccharum TaxID=4024 RepID=A0AA39SKD6_ACESA|nr:hypothetical protein LWI29_009909 [Acer saccharum]
MVSWCDVTHRSHYMLFLTWIGLEIMMTEPQPLHMLSFLGQMLSRGALVDNALSPSPRLKLSIGRLLPLPLRSNNMGTLEQMQEKIKKKLEDPNKSTIVLVGDSGMGKTWMARKISEHDKYYDTLWVYMTEEYNIDLQFYDDIAKQYLSLSPITEEWKHDEDETPLFVIKVEPEEKKADQKEESTKEKIQKKMREIGHALSIEDKHLLLVLDDLGNNSDDLYEKLPNQWRDMFPSKFHDRLKIIITARKSEYRNEQQTIEVIKFPQHLQPQESSDLLKDSVGRNAYEKSNYQQLLEAIADRKSEGIHTPATITVIAKALNYIAEHDDSKLVRAILQAAHYEKTSEGVKLNPLIYCACDMIESSVTKNCFWHSMHLFQSYGGVHYNVLITHWIMEGYFDPFVLVEEAYRKAHTVLTELINRALLKIQENNVVAVEGVALNMIEYCLLGFNDTAALRLFSVFKDNESFGGVTRMKGMIKTLCNPKFWEENYTLLIDDTHLHQGDNQTSLIKSMKELKVLAVFKAKCESPLTSSLSKMEKLLVLVLRSCDLRDHDITHINKLKELKVLEISSRDGHLMSLPDKLFSEMTNLQSLNLSGLQIESLSSLSNLRELRSLILRQSKSSQLEEVLESLKELAKLEILDLSDASSLKSMPSNLFDEITNLQSLNLSGLKLIKSFPSFSKLSKLRVLMLRSCSLLQKLQSLRGLGELQILDISDSISFESFEDKTLSVLPKIKLINLSRTNIQSLPEFDELQDLTQIFLSGCLNLLNLPTLQFLTSLQILDLSGATMFKTFTDQSIQDLDQLRILDVSKTSISKLPSIPSNLLELNLRGCSELKELPSTIYKENLKPVTGEHNLQPGLNYIYV